MNSNDVTVYEVLFRLVCGRPRRIQLASVVTVGLILTQAAAKDRFETCFRLWHDMDHFGLAPNQRIMQHLQQVTNLCIDVTDRCL